MNSNILIADDHELVRDTIAAYLGRTGGFNVHVASDLDEAAGILRDAPNIDLAILDYEMPGMNGLEGLRELRARYPGTKTALMSGVTSNGTAARALRYGACAYLPKSMSVNAMIDGIRQALSGEKFVPYDIETEGPEGPGDRDWGLSPREFEVLELVSHGKSNRDIATALGLKEVTIKLHVTNILSKLGARNRTQAALMAKEKRLF